MTPLARVRRFSRGVLMAKVEGVYQDGRGGWYF